MQRRLWMTCVLAAALIGGPAAARDYTVGTLTVAQPWTRVTPGATRTGSAYLTVINRGQAADRLIGASTPIAERAELHTHQMDGAVMRMRPVDAIELRAGETAELKPGGLHVMLIGLKEPIRAGKPVPLTLRFEKAGAVDVELRVEAAGAAAPHTGGHGAH